MGNIVAIYGDFKRGELNYKALLRNGGKYIKDDYIQFDRLYSKEYPKIKYSNNSNKYIKVELFKINNISLLDTLEGYTIGSDYNLNKRIKIKTESGENVWAYETVGEVKDGTEKFFTGQNEGKLYYNWVSNNFIF